MIFTLGIDSSHSQSSMSEKYCSSLLYSAHNGEYFCHLDMHRLSLFFKHGDYEGEHSCSKNSSKTGNSVDVERAAEIRHI